MMVAACPWMDGCLDKPWMDVLTSHWSMQFRDARTGLSVLPWWCRCMTRTGLYVLSYDDVMALHDHGWMDVMTSHWSACSFYRVILSQPSLTDCHDKSFDTLIRMAAEA
eukprot:COSAG04_NODE_9177_length_891_cov_0.541667_1_plen_108_part_10